MNKHQKHRQLRRLENGVLAAKNSGNKSRRLAAARNYLKAEASKRNAFDLAMREFKGREKPQVKFEDVASRLDLWSTIGDEVKVTPIIRDITNSPPRFILDFPFAHQVRQVLLREFIRIIWQVSPNQTMFDKGTHKAICIVRQNWADGYRHKAELDVQRCYQSFSIKGIAKFLCLPESVAFNVLGVEAHRITPSNRALGGVDYHEWFNQDDPMRAFEENFHEDWIAARQGLAQGSKVSPHVAELLLAPVCDICTESGTVRMVNYADNFLLMAKSPRMLSRHKAILRRLLHDHPAGPLLVIQKSGNSLQGEAFEFLGYSLEPSFGRLLAQPAPKHFKKLKEMRRKAHKLLASDLDDARKLKVLENVERRHRSTVRAFRHWPGRFDYHEGKMVGLRAHLGKRPRRIGTARLPTRRSE